jgi:ubiquinol-cytochrome c reductase cytochrome b subunit
MVTRRAVEWFDDRLQAASFARRALRKAFPDHWAFMLGEIALYCYLILVLTGTFLVFFYVGSGREVVYDGPYPPLRGTRMSAAYDSVLRISFEVRAGLVMRQIHHWAAVVFVAAIAAHMLRVFFTGAFRRPREINWFVGLSLLLLAMFAGFTGYSLPDDLLSGTGLRIAYSVLLSIPVVGTWAAFLLFGGEFPTPDLMSRLYVIHVLLLQGLIVGALTVHLAVVWHQKHTMFRGPGHDEDTVRGSPLWPRYAMKSVGLAFCVFGVLALLGGLAQINPVWLYGPFDPTIVTSPAQPDWYMGWLEGALRLAPPWAFRVFGAAVPEPFLPAVVLPGLVFTVLALWPFIERRITGDDRPHHLLDRPRDAPLRTAVGVAGVSVMAVLTLAGSNDVLANLLGMQIGTFNRAARSLLVALPVATGVAAYAACRELGRRDLHPTAGGRRMVVRRTADGGFRLDPASAALPDQPDHGQGGQGEPQRDQRHPEQEARRDEG